MIIYKFGGASVKDAEGIINLEAIVRKEKGNLIVVVSAFGKTTNALENLLKEWLAGEKNYEKHFDEIYSYHSGVYNTLFPRRASSGNQLHTSFTLLKEYLETRKGQSYDYEYDQIVSFGEIWSTLIISEYLKESGINCEWKDIRKFLITDDTYRDADILWSESSKRISRGFDFSKNRLFVTQGFIGATVTGRSTTLGREGSDYTAALLANILDAESVVVWKDVPGLLNADPKWLPDARKMDEVSYREAVEMTFSGAKVIHPKTIKPLQNKNIPLYVKSFSQPDNEGTIITSDPKITKITPVFIMKEKQILISLLPKDFSFVMGDNLSIIFQQFTHHHIKVNLVEASAVSIDVCVDDERNKIRSILSELQNEYSALYNENVELLTIRHYNQESVDKITSGYDILLEQRTRSTVRFVVKKCEP